MALTVNIISVFCMLGSIFMAIISFILKHPKDLTIMEESRLRLHPILLVQA